MNDAGELAGTLIGLVWLLLGAWMIATGRRRVRATRRWKPTTAIVVDREGGAEGLFVRRPHLRYVDDGGAEHLVPSGSRGGLWEPGTAVDVVVDPDDTGRALLLTHAQRGVLYVVLGWFVVGIAVLTLVSSLMLAVWVPD